MRYNRQRSRFGCKICKFRHVKCDEVKPQCGNCRRYGVECRYFEDTTSAAIVPRGESRLVLPAAGVAASAAAMDVAEKVMTVLDIDSTFGLPVANRDRYGATMLHLFRRFEATTVLSLGTRPIAVVYQSEIVPLAFAHPYLMHILLPLTALHGRHVAQKVGSMPANETRHLQRAVSLFNTLISGPILASERDSIFAMATLLNAMTFGNVDTIDPNESWPLKDKPDHLQWLRIQRGVMVMVEAADPTRPDSIFSKLFKYFGKDIGSLAAPRPGCGGVPETFQRLFDIDDFSDASNNPYHTAVRMLVPLLSIPCTNGNLMIFLPFIGCMDPRLIDLLEAKEPRALQLLGVWFGVVQECDQWWITTRAIPEYQAICTYLRALGAQTPPDIVPNVRQDVLSLQPYSGSASNLGQL